MSNGCIICGQDNPIGLKMRFANAEDGVRCEFAVPPAFQGFDGVTHGGTVGAILDDAMWWAIYRTRGVATMTAEMKVRYHAPVPVETDLLVTARVDSHRGRLHRTSATICRNEEGGGAPLAEAEGAYLSPPVE